MVRDTAYDNANRVWGEQPEELGLFACNFLKHTKLLEGNLDILDVGCGDGRNTIYLATNLDCYILGIDSSQNAIDRARESCPKELGKRLEFLCYDFDKIIDRYNVLFASNIYEKLNLEERVNFRKSIRRCLKTGGLLFLSAISVKDTHLFGKGLPVPGEVNSFREDRLIHFCTREELEIDFDFLSIHALFEKEYNEPHSREEIHRHISWILMGQMK